MPGHILATIQSELSDLDDIERLTRVCVRLLVATLLGAAIGWERELRESTAGLRTHMLVALGCAVFVLVPLQGGMAPGDMSRLLQGVIAGVGFLGAGAVLKSEEGHVRGLTTAASVWATAAIGVTVGLGHEATAILVTLFTLFILAVVWRVERRMMKRRLRSGMPDRSRPPDTT